MQRSISDLLRAQRDYFKSGETKTLEARRKALMLLFISIRHYENDIAAALREDLGKASAESYFTETGIVLSEIRELRHHLKSWMAPKRVHTPLLAFPAKSFIQREPLGNVLIFSPWNYPLHLSLLPMADAIAAGNTCIVKPSRSSPATSEVLHHLVTDALPETLASVLIPDDDTADALLNEKFDFIFYTGSARVGKIVATAAAKTLTPVCLELGGKSPALVAPDANLKIAAKRIAWGKLINAGQTCVAPDYVLISKTRKKEFIEEVEKAWTAFLGVNVLENPRYPKIINRRAFERLSEMNPKSVEANWEQLKIAPQVFEASAQDAIMSEEIFGPLLPVLNYENLDDAIAFINSRDKPLALYLFTESKSVERKVFDQCSFGGGAVNDVLLHVASHFLPFGGVGKSGMGKYHGKAGFDLFSNVRGTMRQGTHFDPPFRYELFKEKMPAWMKKIL